MSRNVSLEQEYENVLEKAKKHVSIDKKSRRLILLVDKNGLKHLSPSNQKTAKELRHLGVVNLTMDNKIYLSNLGKTIAKIVKNLPINNN